MVLQKGLLEVFLLEPANQELLQRPILKRGPWSEWPGPLSTWPCHCLHPWGQIHAWGLKWLSWLFSVLCWNELNECHPFKGPLGRLCPHSTWVTTLLDHFSGKCPQSEATATWGHLFHCLRIMPYFNKSKEKNPGKQVLITVSPKLDSRFVCLCLNGFPKNPVTIGELFSVGVFNELCVPQAPPRCHVPQQGCGKRCLNPLTDWCHWRQNIWIPKFCFLEKKKLQNFLRIILCLQCLSQSWDT